jgi:hypothetical protein
VEGTRASNFTLSTASYQRLTYTGVTFDAPESDWSLSPDNGALQYDGTSQYAYTLQACLLSAQLDNVLSTAGLRVLIALANYTNTLSPSILTQTTSTDIFNHSNPLYIPSVCTQALPIAQVFTSNRFAIYVSFEYTNGASIPAVILALSSWSLTATPLACRGTVNNINITAQFNGSQLINGTCWAPETIDAFTLAGNSLFDAQAAGYSCFARSGPRCSRTFTFSGLCSASANGGSPVADAINFKNSSTIAASRSGQDFSFDSLLTFTGSKCYTANLSGGSTVTVGGSGVCSAAVVGASSSCLTASTNANGNLTLNYEGLCAIHDSDTISCSSPVAGGITCHATGSLCCNLTGCANCTNGTLEVRRLCSQQPQCEVSADPPVTDPGATYTPHLCFTCGFPHGGDGGGDSGGSGAPIVPLLPPIVPIGFFPPIVPVFPPSGGAGGGSGGGSGGGPPGVLPIITVLPVGDPEPVTIGGLKIPLANFTDRVVFCGPSTHGQAILENGTLPEVFYICQRVFNGTYAWQPYPAGSSAASNITIIYLTTTAYFNDSTTVYIDSTSQLINYGNTFLQTLTLGSGGLDSCAAPLHVKNISTAGCGANTSFTDRLALDASFVDVYGSLTVCQRSTRFGLGPGPIFADSIFPCNTAGTLEIAPLGTTVTNNVIVGGTLTVPGALSVTNGSIPHMLNGFTFTTTPPVNPLSPPVCEWTCDGPDEFTAIATLSGARGVQLPAIDVDGSGTFCSSSFPSQKTITTQTILSCDGSQLSLNATNIALNGAVSMASPSISYPSLARASCLSAGAASCSITLNAQRGLVRVNVSTNAIGPGSTFDIIMSNTFSNFGQTFALVQTVQEDAIVHIAAYPPIMFALGSTQDTNQLVIRTVNPTLLLSQPINSAFIVFFNIFSYTDQ